MANISMTPTRSTTSSSTGEPGAAGPSTPTHRPADDAHPGPVPTLLLEEIRAPAADGDRSASSWIRCAVERELSRSA